mmetsp:Transcript_56381/g.160051  ORF Transcript_56381/g.160051 Transcript_56381/m.160051 type:complete len:308 (+) Transcript_56381:201-1124(+)|eukprot:CAMPEP_0168372304 /NCGR_PEP_ID=MMETSP0228-20121227/8214_1 /TAXON_ID=133427 /ORGANISM="Protoceratium reticulatum, Strain CCCM 535 (=CCMP 1889)" /LENGTH=307 /DNA_ID=CAMNT_0008385211 /DNA_START=154 /DNA_END=1077 /DNA_ORIENTATION=-
MPNADDQRSRLDELEKGPTAEPDQVGAKNLPDFLHGRMLVMIGDSNDRFAIDALCSVYNGSISYISQFFKNDGSVPLNSSNEGTDTRMHICNFEAHKFTAVSLFHFGVMSMKGQPDWHAESLQGARSRFLHLLENGTRVHATDDLIKLWYPRAIADIALSRPTVVVAQSSLWDSCLLHEYLARHKQSLSAAEAWSMMDGWIDFSTAFIKSISDSGIPFKQMCWRTNPNCPLDDHFYDGISNLQAQEVRQKIAGRQGLWADVCLIDWRAAVHVEDPENCVAGGSLHYRTQEYSKLWETAWEAISLRSV